MGKGISRCLKLNLIQLTVCFASLSIVFSHRVGIGKQPLSKIAIHKATVLIHTSASIAASPLLLGLKGEDTEWVTVDLYTPEPSAEDWVAVFSPAKFNSSACPPVDKSDSEDEAPYICLAPIKYKYANYSNSNYSKTGKASLKFQLINQRADFSFALFTGGLSNYQTS